MSNVQTCYRIDYCVYPSEIKEVSIDFDQYDITKEDKDVVFLIPKLHDIFNTSSVPIYRDRKNAARQIVKTVQVEINDYFRTISEYQEEVDSMKEELGCKERYLKKFCEKEGIE